MKFLELATRNLFFTGKGGVSKTTAAVAVELSRRGHTVHLTTTDPAAHLQEALATVPLGLSVSRIDPHVETRAYRDEVLASAGAGHDPAGRALLEEDLRSPCTEEVAVFRALARVVDQGENGFVVLDTAPTGHTILLLDAALAYHRELSRQSRQVEPCVRQLLPRLRDPAFTRILVVTLPEATPVHEAEKLEQDLCRAEIPTFAWIVNQCLSPLSIQDPSLLARRQRESHFLSEVAAGGIRRVAAVPSLITPVTDIGQITSFGVMLTPALAVDGQVKVVG